MAAYDNIRWMGMKIHDVLHQRVVCDLQTKSEQRIIL